jgi:hypothetical protein
MYVSIKPAIILESDPAEPKVKRNPKKTETPLKWANRFLGDKEKSDYKSKKQTTHVQSGR